MRVIEGGLVDRYERAAEKALADAEKYRRKGDDYLAQGHQKRADLAYSVAERKLLKAQTAMCFIRG